MALYNLIGREWKREGLKRGDPLRVNRIYRCEICNADTNAAVIGGWPSMGPRLLCPGDRFLEHDDLESALKRYHGLENKIREYGGVLENSSMADRESTRDMMSNLYAERRLLRSKISQLRKRFSGTIDNIEGLGRDQDVIEYYPFARYNGVKVTIESLSDEE